MVGDIYPYGAQWRCTVKVHSKGAQWGAQGAQWGAQWGAQGCTVRYTVKCTGCTVRCTVRCTRCTVRCTVKCTVRCTVEVHIGWWYVVYIWSFVALRPPPLAMQSLAHVLENLLIKWYMCLRWILQRTSVTLSGNLVCRRAEQGMITRRYVGFLCCSGTNWQWYVRWDPYNRRMVMYDKWMIICCLKASAFGYAVIGTCIREHYLSIK